MKEKLKRNVSLVLLFVLFLGMFTHLSIYTDSVIEAKAADIPTTKSNICPHGGNTHDDIGMAVCWGCQGTTCTDAGCTETAIGGRMYFGDGIHNVEWYDSDVEELTGTHPENYHRGRGYNTRRITTDTGYAIEYYACYNCVGGQDNSHKYDAVRLMWTEYYNSDGTRDTRKGGGTGKVENPKYTNGEMVTNGRYRFKLQIGEGVVAIYWCSSCGKTLWEENGYMDKKCPDCDGYYASYNIGYAEPLMADELDEAVLHVGEKHTLILSALADGGTVSLDGKNYARTVMGDYYEGDKVKIYSRANAGFSFSQWQNEAEKQVSTVGEDTVTMPGKDYTLYAAFDEETKYALTLESGEHGSVNDEINGSYMEGTDLRANAIPEDGYRFAGWTGHDVGKDKPATFEFQMPVAPEGVKLKANFEPVPTPTPVSFTISLSVCEGCDACDGADTKTYAVGRVSFTQKHVAPGTKVEIDATAMKHYEFSHWTNSTGTSGAADAEQSVEVKESQEWKAHFKCVQYTVTAEAGTGGTVNSEEVSAKTYSHKDTVALKAVPEEGYSFAWWKNAATGKMLGAEAEMSCPVTGNASYKAVFSKEGEEPGGTFPEATPTPTPKLITVAFDPDGGTVSPASKKAYAGGIYGTLPTPKKDGHEFIAWVYVDGGSKNTVDASTQVQSDEDHTLHAEYVEMAVPTPVPTATPIPTPTPTPVPHVCGFGDWKYTSAIHWKECVCGAKSEEESHDYEQGDPDETGQTTYTCKDCGYSKSQHTHKWEKWYPTYPYSSIGYENFFSDDYFAQLLHDAATYHWMTCSYPACGKSMPPMKHTKGELADEGGGYLVARCTTCYWIMEKVPVTVNLTINPNGGTFPNGSTGRVTFTDIPYGELTELGVLGTEYFPEKPGADFQGYYIVEENFEGCVYAPDYDTQTCTGKPEYFRDNGNGTYTSLLKRDYTVHAQWRQSEYTVEYSKNAEDATGIMYPSYHKVGEEKALSQIAYYLDSHITYDTGDVAATLNSGKTVRVQAGFLGWTKTADGSVAYADKQKVKNLLGRAGTVTLYAVWDYGTVTLPKATATDGGQKLAGWKRTDGTVISVLDENGSFRETEYRVQGDETLTAVWVPNAYTVAFETGGGTECSPVVVTYRKPYGYGNGGLPSSEKEGYIFKGWRDAVTRRTVTDDTIVTTPEDHVLEAVWEPVEVAITLDYNFDFGVLAKPEKNNAEEYISFYGMVIEEIGENTDRTTRNYGKLLALPVPSREGYNFLGWYLEEDENGNGCGEEGCMVPNLEKLAVAQDSVFHARWEARKIYIKLDYNYDYSVWGEE